MNTLPINTNLYSVSNNVLIFPGGKNRKTEHNDGPLKSNGQPKATPADPIRTIEEVQRMQDYFLEKGQLRNYLLLTLGISFAIRASDLLCLKWADFFNTDWSVKMHFIIYEKKTGKRNKVHINSKCRTILEEYLQSLKYDPKLSDTLFTSRQRDAQGNLKGLTIQQLNNILSKAAKECKVNGHISSHSLRKTFAYHTIKINEGDQEALLALQYMYNHSDIRVTFRYCGIEDDKIAGMREDIGNLLI